MKQRHFKIREELLTGQRRVGESDITSVEFNKPIPDVVWMRYQLTLAAMIKRFTRTEELFEYVETLEDFIFSAGAPER